MISEAVLVTFSLICLPSDAAEGISNFGVGVGCALPRFFLVGFVGAGVAIASGAGVGAWVAIGTFVGSTEIFSTIASVGVLSPPPVNTMIETITAAMMDVATGSPTRNHGLIRSCVLS